MRRSRKLAGHPWEFGHGLPVVDLLTASLLVTKFEFECDDDAEVARFARVAKMRGPLRSSPKASDPLLLVTWNTANFGVQDRRDHDRRLITEILGRFDVIVTQQTRSNLGGPGLGCRAPSALSPDAFVTESNRRRFDGRHQGILFQPFTPFWKQGSHPAVCPCAIARTGTKLQAGRRCGVMNTQCIAASATFIAKGIALAPEGHVNERVSF
jgi:hypothetical protein